MPMLFSLVLSIHVVMCVFLILVVLLQAGKGGGFAGLVGGGGSDAVFSAPSGTAFIKKVTTGVAVAFFITSLLLTYLGARKGVRSVTREYSIPISPSVPAAAEPPKADAHPAQPGQAAKTPK